MARIQMQTAKNMTMEDCFKLFLSVTAAKGVLPISSFFVESTHFL